MPVKDPSTGAWFEVQNAEDAWLVRSGHASSVPSGMRYAVSAPLPHPNLEVNRDPNSGVYYETRCESDAFYVCAGFPHLAKDARRVNN